MTEPTPAELARRLDRLERENRRLKRGFVAALMAVACLALAAAAPVPNDGAVSGKSFRVLGDDSAVRAELAATASGSQLLLYDKAGALRVRAEADVQGTGPAVTLLGADGKPWLLTAGHESIGEGKVRQVTPYLLVQDRNGVPVGELRKHN